MKIKMINSTMVYCETGLKDDDGYDIIYKGYKIGVIFENGLHSFYHLKEYDSDFYKDNRGLYIITSMFDNLDNKDFFYTYADIQVSSMEDVDNFMEEPFERFGLSSPWDRYMQYQECEHLERVMPGSRRFVTKEEAIKEVEEWR